MTNNHIHTKLVPRLQATLWTVAMFMGAVCLLDIKNTTVVKLLAVFIVFLVFIWEVALTFLDLKSQYEDKNFKGNFLGINVSLFFIIPLAFLFGILYYIFSSWEIFFYLTILTMGWLKFEMSSFTNNIESYLVNIKPTFDPNPINK